MANFEIKFKDSFKKDCSVMVFKCLNHIDIRIDEDGSFSMIRIDKSTAIKFAKTLRTEINKITESEVNDVY
jgi:hypothetical protein